jgi:molybdopterin-guanine dinucleotide biosynthesis protein A
MDKSAIILAGGSSTRFGQDKGLLRFTNKPLIKRVLDATNNLVDEKIVVISSTAQAEKYTKVLGSDVRVVADSDDLQTPIVGTITGLEAAKGTYSLLLACDVPFVSKEVLALLLDLCTGKNAAIPRWPNGYIEPLQAVYCTKPTLEAAKSALNEGKMNMQAMVDKLRGIRYISTLVIQQLDPQLKTFFNINTPLDLRKAENMLGRE